MLNITKKGKLIAFFYRLMRDTVPPGVVEKFVQEIEHSSLAKEYKEPKMGDTFEYSNNWLAEYAEDITKRLLS